MAQLRKVSWGHSLCTSLLHSSPATGAAARPLMAFTVCPGSCVDFLTGILQCFLFPQIVSPSCTRCLEVCRTLTCGSQPATEVCGFTSAQHKLFSSDTCRPQAACSHLHSAVPSISQPFSFIFCHGALCFFEETSLFVFTKIPSPLEMLLCVSEIPVLPLFGFGQIYLSF